MAAHDVISGCARSGVQQSPNINKKGTLYVLYPPPPAYCPLLKPWTDMVVVVVVEDSSFDRTAPDKTVSALLRPHLRLIFLRLACHS